MITPPRSTATASTRSSEPAPERAWPRPPAWAWWEIAAGAGVVLVGLFLRLNGYADTPTAQANADEWGLAWAGQTLLTHGVPMSWSYLGAYHHYQVIRLHGTGYPLVSPWLDHPPLFPIIVGAFQVIAGEHTLAASTTDVIRLPSVILGSVSIGLAQVAGRRLVGPAAALCGAALLATAPAAVLLSREVETDALLAPLLLIAILLVHWLRTGEGALGTAVALAIVAAAAAFTKVPGLAVGGLAAVVLLVGRLWLPAALAAGGALLGLAAYALFGAHYDWSIFVAVLNAQSSRRAGVLGAFEFIAEPAGVNQRLRDGWWLLGWLALAAAAVTTGRSSPRQWLLAWPAIAYLVAIAALADERVVARYGWYHVAVYPLVYVAAGAVVWRAVARPQLPLLALVLALGGATAAELSLGSPWNPPAWLLLVVLAAFLLPVLVTAVRPADGVAARWARLVALVALALMLLGNFVEALSLQANFGLF